MAFKLWPGPDAVPDPVYPLFIVSLYWIFLHGISHIKSEGWTDPTDHHPV